MKKLGLIFLMAMLFVCAFAFTVVAADVSEWTEITETAGMSDKASFGADGTSGATSRVLMSDGKTYPAYYILKDSTKLEVDFAEINKKTGITYDKANVIRLEIPNGIVTLVRLQNYTALLEVVVPEGVEVAVDSFLYNLTTVEKVTLPSTLKTIEYGAFYKIGAVESLVIPDGCESIGEIAFKLSNIKSVEIPASVKNVGKNAFLECPNLETVVCKAETIGYQSFKSCAVLSNLDIDGVKAIGEQAFYACSALKTVVIPDSCETIETLAFKTSGIVNLTVGSGLTSVKTGVFEGCESLSTIVYKSKEVYTKMFWKLANLTEVELVGTEKIEDYAFYESGVVSITIPSSLTTVGTNLFVGCERLEKVVYNAKEVFDNMFKGLGTITKIELIGTEKIGKYAFYQCGAVQNLVIPNTCHTIDDKAFMGSGVVSVTVPSSVKTIGTDAFSGSLSLSSIYHYATISGANMYKGCSAVETLVIDNLVTAGAHSFRGFVKITSIEFPKSLTTVGDYAFEGLSAKKIIIPESVISIGSSSFGGNASLKKAVVLCNSLGGYSFAGCSNLNEIVVTDNLTTFTGNPFNNCPQNGVTVIVVGEGYEAVRTLTKSNTRFAGTMYDYADYVPGSYGSKNVFIYNANLCEVVYGEHIEDNNPCVINCERCEVSGKAEKNPVHSEDITIVYDRFDMAGKRIVYCTNEGCKHGSETEVKEMFEYLGHSASEFGTAGLALCYIVNYDALGEYKSVTGNTVEFGVFAALETKLGQDDIFDENGQFIDCVVGQQLSNRTPDAFELKVAGFTTDEQKATKIVFGAYVVTKKDGKSSISYMQNGSPEEGKYYSTSYNDIVG